MPRYAIVPERSRVTIDATSSVHPIHSEMAGLEGWIELGTEPKGHLQLAVERLSSRNPLEDRELRRRIDARRYPSIDGDLLGMKSINSDGRYLVRGTVTFRGVTREYEDEMTLTGADSDRLTLEGRHTFDIRDFGMEPPRILMLKVHPEVAVSVEIVAERET